MGDEMNENDIKNAAVQSMNQNLGNSDSEFEQVFSNPTDAIMQGSGMIQTKTAYSTAVQVIKPRNLNTVLARCLEESAIAGEDFYYSWPQGGQNVEGLTIGAALSIARNFGNCAVDVKVEDLGSGYVFHGAFIDLETGFNIVRPYRQRKESPKTKTGKDVYTGERGTDIIFQIGASKAMRNVVLNAIPKWLANKVITKAKENVGATIEKMGIPESQLRLAAKAKNLNISLERIEAHYGKQKSWEKEQLILISGALRAIENGYDTIDSLFPETNTKTNAETNNKEQQPTTNDKKQTTQQQKPEKKIINFKNEVSVTANIRNLNTPKEIAQFKADYDEELKALQVEDEAAFNKIIEKLDARNYELTTK